MTNKYRKAVFMVTYARGRKGVEYLIMKRKKHWIGWEFPKGGVEKEESLMQAVKREIFEETGKQAVKIRRFNFFGRYTYKRRYLDRPGYIGQSYILFSTEIKKGEIKMGPEHSEYLWLDFKEAMKKLRFYNQKKCLKIVNNWLEKNEIQRKNS